MNIRLLININVRHVMVLSLNNLKFEWSFMLCEVNMSLHNEKKLASS